MLNETNLDKQVNEKYIAWIKDRDNPELQKDVWMILQNILVKTPKDWTTLSRLAYISSYMNYGRPYAIEFTKRVLNLRKDDIRIQLVIADVFYTWGKNWNDQEIIKTALNFYNKVQTENPNLFYLSHASERKRDCIKTLWAMQELIKPYR